MQSLEWLHRHEFLKDKAWGVYKVNCLTHKG